MFRRIALFSLFFILITLLGCTLKPETAAPVKEKNLLGVTSPSIRTGWEAEWEKTTTRAREERKIVAHVMAGFGPAILDEFRHQLKSKFGLDFEIVVGRAAEMAAKVIIEQQKGLYLTDVWLHGANALLEMIKPIGALAPLEPALILPLKNSKTKISKHGR